MLRLERLRRSRDAFIDAREKCVEMEQLITKQLGATHKTKMHETSHYKDHHLYDCWICCCFPV